MAIKTIVIKGTGIRAEALANEAITPGKMVELLSTGKVQLNDTTGMGVEKAFAVEDDLQGNAIDDDYASGGLVQYEMFNAGDEVFAFLADGEAAVIGSRLVPTTGGELAVATGDSSAVVSEAAPIAIAKQALDMSDSSAADPSSNRIKVRII